jgi:hypothetical protein
MNHLPIVAVTGRALWFEIRNVFTLFRLTWLPLVVLIATEWVIAYWLVWQAPPGTTAETLSDDGVVLLISLGTALLEGLALSVVAVRVHRMILFNDNGPGEYFAFPFGRTELLYVLMGALTFMVVIVFVAAGIFLAAFLGVVPLDSEAANSNPGVKPALIVLLVIAYFVVLWLSLRLMVWPPAVVANNRLSLGEAWRLTRGKALAMLGLGIFSSFVIMVPIAFVAFSIMSSEGLAKIKAVADFKAALPFASLDEKLVIALAHPGRLPDLNAVLLELAANFVFTTYTVAILSYAYKALKGFDAHEAIDANIEHADDGLEAEAVGAH